MVIVLYFVNYKYGNARHYIMEDNVGGYAL